MAAKLVSVIVLTHNRQEWVCEAVQSVLDSNYSNIELIVVNNGSTDNTQKILKKKFGHYSCFSILNIKEDIGMSYAINKGLKAAHGEYLRVLADDDQIFPNAIRNHAEFLDDHPEIDFVYSDITVFHDNEQPRIVKGSPINYDLREALIKKLNMPFKPNISLAYLLSPNEKSHRIPAGPGLIRKRVHDSGIYYCEDLPTKFNYSSDYEFYIAVVFAGFKLAYLPILSTKYRLHDDQVVAKMRKDKKSMIEARQYVYNKYKQKL